MARDSCDSFSHGKEMAMGVLDRFRLDGKRLFVTGGSRGLGREMALAIADAGADVVLVGRDLASLEKTGGDVRALGRKAWTIQGDAGIPAECERICRTALEDFGPIDILINNAALIINKPFQDFISHLKQRGLIATCERVFETNPNQVIVAVLHFVQKPLAA